MEKVEVNPLFAESLECPVCYDFYDPPIYFCQNGHSLCHRCTKISKPCPLCRAPLTQNFRNYSLENILGKVTVPCKYAGCNESITLFERSNHLKNCKFNNNLNCIECDSSEENLIMHLIKVHDYKEIIMQDSGGLRSFSGPQESWLRDTEWPKGVWKFGKSNLIVRALSCSGIFHVYLYRIEREPVFVKLSLDLEDCQFGFKGKLPHISDYQEKSPEPHFNCDVNLLLEKFVKRHEDDEDILRLWIRVSK
ncbi:hypothetical protein SteCoe_30536 [Stentor coeruleus]|uniref:RING-type domain-containing protein n=1 Tax=Stentor coeruleus TaxID=5963 RepID=A0A1R2B3H0_9CILI|nr:hypothetical protein SteCoe_30536 [Stentor coeruleus]